MAEVKVLALCQSGGEFVKSRDGSLSYSGGEAHAIEIDRDMAFSDLKDEISNMFNYRANTFSIKYFLPNNKKTPITVSNDKDLQRMIDFQADSLTTDIYVMQADNRTMSVVADSDTPTDTTGTVDTLSGELDHAEEDNLITGVGQVFDSPKELRDTIQKYAVARNFTYKVVKIENQRLNAVCATEGCPWRIYASMTAAGKEFTIKKWNNTHTCGRKARPSSNRSNKQFVVDVLKEKLRTNPDYKTKNIKDDIEQEYGLTLNYSQAWRGKFFAKKEIENSHEEASSRLPWYCKRILETNPGSAAGLEVSDDKKFKLFIAFHASRVGFEHGCRPLLFLDAIVLNASKQWKLLTACAVDGENCIYPVGFSVVDEETRENWAWFVVQLKLALSTMSNITFISSMEHGLGEATQVFEESYHGYDLNHLSEKFKTRMDEESFTEEIKEEMLDVFHKSVYACSTEEFNECMEHIKSESEKLYEWILATKPELWSNAFFKGSRYGQYSSTASDTFNSWIPKSTKHEPSVVQIVDAIRCKLMEVMYTRRSSSSTWRDTLTPSMHKKIEEDIATAQNLEIICSTGKVFEVRDGGVHVVNTETWECTCSKWQVNGFPCVHAIAALDRTDECAFDYCSKYFTNECYQMAYALPITPMPDAGVVDSMEGETSQGRGRPKRKRDEEPIISSKKSLRCSKCDEIGHNKRTCKASP